MSISDVISSAQQLIVRVHQKDRLWDKECSDLLSQSVTALEECGRSKVCLSVKDACAAQQAGQILWNATTHNETHWLEAEKYKKSLRYLSALLFLHGNHCFSQKQMQEAYLRSHPMEAEKCFLLCLKTAKDFSEDGNSVRALDMLNLASSIREGSTWGSRKSLQLDIEVLFAEMAVQKDLHHWEVVLRKAEVIMDLTASRWPQREALLHFIFELGEDPGEAVTPDAEVCLQNLLQLSVNMQKSTSAQQKFLLKDSILLGVTYMQMAMSYMRSARFNDALQWVEAAIPELSTPEPLVMKAACHAALKQSGEAVSVFSSILSLRVLSLDDIFSISYCIADSDSGAIEGIRGCLKRFPSLNPSTPFEPFAFYFISFVAHFCLAQGIDDAFSTIESVAVDSPLCHSFFQLLWGISGMPSELEVPKQIKLLHDTLNFSSRSSTSEIDCVLCHLGEISLREYEKNGDTALLTSALQRYGRHSVDSSIFTRVILCQLKFLHLHTLADSELDDALTCKETENGSDVLYACGALAHFFLQHDALELASYAAKKALSSGTSVPEEERTFLKIFAVSLLHSPSTLSLTDVNVLAQRLTVPLLLCTDADDVLWWCRLLWYIGDLMEDQDGGMRIEVCTKAIDIWLSCLKDSAADELRPLLMSRMTLVMDEEFNRFVGDAAAVPVEKLQKYLGEAESVGVPLKTIFLAKCECALRSLNSPETSGQCCSLLSTVNLAQNACDTEDCEALALAIFGALRKYDTSDLRETGVQLLLFSVRDLFPNEKTQESFTITLRLLYRAYTLTNRVSSQLDLCTFLTNLLSLSATTAPTRDFSKEPFPQAIVEFFAVESWNICVQYNSAGEARKVESWKALTATLCEALEDLNYTKSILQKFLVKMPVL